MTTTPPSSAGLQGVLSGGSTVQPTIAVAPALRPGMAISGRVEILAPLKSGGLNVVWHGIDRHLRGMPCAVKVVIYDPSLDAAELDQRKDMLSKETDTLLALKPHPHICRPLAIYLWSQELPPGDARLSFLRQAARLLGSGAFYLRPVATVPAAFDAVSAWLLAAMMTVAIATSLLMALVPVKRTSRPYLGERSRRYESLLEWWWWALLWRATALLVVVTVIARAALLGVGVLGLAIAQPRAQVALGDALYRGVFGVIIPPIGQQDAYRRFFVDATIVLLLALVPLALGARYLYRSLPPVRAPGGDLPLGYPPAPLAGRRAVLTGQHRDTARPPLQTRVRGARHAAHA